MIKSSDQKGAKGGGPLYIQQRICSLHRSKVSLIATPRTVLRVLKIETSVVNGTVGQSRFLCVKYLDLAVHYHVVYFARCDGHECVTCAQNKAPAILRLADVFVCIAPNKAHIGPI